MYISIGFNKLLYCSTIILVSAKPIFIPIFKEIAA